MNNLDPHTAQFAADCAARYQQRADECLLLIHHEERQDKLDGGLITMLEIHAAHWQALAHGAASVAQTKGRGE